MGELERAISGFLGFLRRAVAPTAAAALLVFSAPTATREGDVLTLRGALAGCVNEKVRRVLGTGTPLTVRFRGRLTRRGTGDRWTARAANVLRYDTLSGRYHVAQNGTTTEHAALRPAVAAFSSYRLAFRGVAEGGALDCEVDAAISYPSALGIEGASAALWNHETPYQRIRDLQLLLPAPQPIAGPERAPSAPAPLR